MTDSELKKQADDIIDREFLKIDLEKRYAEEEKLGNENGLAHFLKRFLK